MKGVVVGAFIISFFHLLFVVTDIRIASHTPFFNMRVLSYLLCVLAMSVFVWSYKKISEKNPESSDEYPYVSYMFFFMINFLLIWLASIETLDYFNNQYSLLTSAMKKEKAASFANMKQVSLSVCWMLYGVALLAIGIIMKKSVFRLSAITILSISVFKVFLFDSQSLSDFYRFIAYITLGIILLTFGFLYNRYQERIQDFMKAG